ncbi:hypothetical protein [Flavobacterium sp.]|uniref:hypothetical protein n=1 Tax=Flavobacterium sp. TaxID=239 RepID=UPI0025C568C7|nr:hypothetical protein [Flavobacterium sp.]
MKRIFLYSMSILLFAFGCGCGNDDNAKAPFEGRLLKRMTIEANYPENNQTADFTYDSKHRIATITLVGEIDDFFTYAYNNRNQVTSISKANGEDFAFEYDNEGRLSGYTEGNVDHAVVYNSGNQTYTINGSAFVLKENGDILTENGMTYNYSSVGSATLKGPLRDVVGSSYQLTTYLAQYDAIVYMVKDSFTGRSGNPDALFNFTLTNGYDYQDYTMQTNYGSFGLTFHCTFEYFQNE